MTDDEDRIDDMEAQRLRNIDQPVTIDPLMQAQLDKDRQLTQPKAVESFTGKDFADYYNQTQGFGIDDIARNVPLLGGLMSMQDDNIRKAALKGLQDGTLKIGSEDEFNAIKSLVTTAPQQSFLSKLFGAREDFTAPTGLPETFADYNKGKPIGADLGPDKFVMDYGFVPTTANTKAELDDLPANTILSPDNATNIIRDMGKNMPFKGTMSENISKAMLGIREKEKVDPITKEKKTVAVVNSPEGEKELDAKTMRGFVNNAETIQQSVLDLTAGKRADGSPDTSRPIGSGPPSVEEIFNELHGFDKGGLASKPKPKPKRKRTTKKGLGVKTKAT
jgi:hypothetical protein